eukprot:scaffold31656_cov160-Skeletonema_menzelii.AAC.1
MMICLSLFRCVGAFVVAAADTRLAKDASVKSRRGSSFVHPSLRRNLAIIRPSSSLFDTRGGGSDDNSYISAESSSNKQLESLLDKAQQHLREKDADQAFVTLAQAYGIDPTSTTIAALFESCLSLKVELAEELYSTWKNDAGNAPSEGELTNLFQDRMGLSSLFIDKEKYDEAGIQLRKAIEEAQHWLTYTLQLSDTPSTPPAQLDLTNTQFAHWQPSIDRAQYLLYRTNAACCQWETYFQDGRQLSHSLSHNLSPSGHVQRILHPFDALKFPCISLELASKIAQSYAARALESHRLVDAEESNVKQHRPRRPTVTVNRKEMPKQQQKIRIAYISPDFTSRHPLAFLMQHVFRYHDKSQFSVNIYSLSSKVDDGPEVQAIQESCDQFTYLSPEMSPMELYQRMVQDELDIIVDLCGYAGTSIIAEIMASRCLLQQVNDNISSAGGNRADGSTRCLPIHVSYMGFPGSIGSSQIWDYSIFDQVVIPPGDEYGIRKYYNEALVYMPHCYFVNSHKTVLGAEGDGTILANEEERIQLRSKYGIHPTAFVYCCHSRPDKIDPSTFRSWIRALSVARSEYFAKHSDERDLSSLESGAPILWLLRSGKEMEQNLRQLVRREFGETMEDALLFADVAERNEHLRRLGCADVFLDTPAYNAHTLGCDALYIGLPMISLLSSEIQPTSICDEQSTIATDKLASRVGASLLRAAEIEDFVYPTMSEYEDAMVKCVINNEWFKSIRERLRSSVRVSPLFDTERWVQNLEASFIKMKSINEGEDNEFPDIVVSDH